MLILMNVIVVGIEKISMAQHHVSEWVIRLIQILGVPAEDIEDGPTAMHEPHPDYWTEEIRIR